MVVMATMMVPGEATIISNYLTVSSWGMLDTYQVLIVPYLTSAMGIFLFRQFYMTLSRSHCMNRQNLTAAKNLKFIVKILLPLTKSAIIGYGSVHLHQCMEHVHVATSCDRFQQYANRSGSASACWTA